MQIIEIIKKSLLFKVAITLGLSLFLFFAGYVFFKYILYKNNTIIENVQNQDLSKTVNIIIKIRTDWYKRILIDYACFDWMVHFIEKPDLVDAKKNISPPSSIGIDAIQIYNLNKKVVYVDLSPSIKDTIIIPPYVFDTLFAKRSFEYYYFAHSLIYQISGSTVHFADDLERKNEPKGYIFVLKQWDSTYIKEIESLTNAHAIVNYGAINDTINNTTALMLYSPQGKVIANVAVKKQNHYYKSQIQINRYFDIFFVLFCAALMAVIYHTNAELVLKPLKSIENALHGNIDSVSGIIKKKDEFGEISRLIVNFKEQRNILETQNREITKQNAEITKQKLSIERQNNEITDSIRYASIIQHAVLVPSVELSSIFKDYFVFFQPKNIVSGDFYWFKKKCSKLIIVGADCTGHGLSGALLSMLGISFLNEIVSQLDEEELHASDILNSLRTFLIDSLHQTGEIGEVQDGMNVVLCIYDLNKCELEYSGAYNPLYIVTSDNEGKPILNEYKGDSMPVGIYAKSHSFTNFNIEIKKGDILYIASDGYSDQFGGPDSKKFRSKNFKQLLFDTAHLPLHQQKEELHYTFQNWRGNLEQVDDVMVLGFKL